MSAAPGEDRTAVVTGAAGFLGRAFAAGLRARGFDVRGLDVRPGPAVEIADVSRPGQWTRLLEGADLVVHAAAITAPSGDEATFWRVNVEGARTLLGAAAAGGTRRVLHLSTTAVLGARAPDGADETTPVRPSGNPLTDTAVSAEHQALMTHAAGRVAVTVVRLGEVYGPHAEQWTVRPVELLRRGLLVLPDGGRGVLSPTYVDDAVDGALAAALAPSAAGLVVHVTGGEAVPAADFFGRYAALLGASVRTLPPLAARVLSVPVDALARNLGLPPPLPARGLESLMRRGACSIARAAEVLGWRPRVPLDDGMAHTAEWLRDTGLVPAAEPAGAAHDGGREPPEGVADH